MSALYKTATKFGQAPKLLKLSSPAVTNVQSRKLNLLEYQSKGLLQVTDGAWKKCSLTWLSSGLWSYSAEVSRGF